MASQGAAEEPGAALGPSVHGEAGAPPATGTRRAGTLTNQWFLGYEASTVPVVDVAC
jgi:hypothetical protein